MNERYQAWLDEVDDIIDGYCGKSRKNLPEWDWRLSYDCELSPEEAVVDCLIGTGLYVPED